MDVNSRALIGQAADARAKAYAPYPGLAVGAAPLARSDKVFSGCNMENLSFGLTMCAERVCVGNAIAAGEGESEVIAIVASDRETIVPCRQVLAEFNPNLVIYSTTPDGQVSKFRLEDLLPLPRQGILEL